MKHDVGFLRDLGLYFSLLQYGPVQMPNIYWFQILKCDDLMLFFVLYDSR